MQVRSLAEFEAEAVRFARTLSPRESGATVVTLSGELGAGKTTFVQTLAHAFGVAGQVTSPTFVIEKAYALTGQAFARLVHIDAYRLEDAPQLEVLGWNEMIADAGNLIVLEWPEKVAAAIPQSAIRLRFDIEGDARTIREKREQAQDRETLRTRPDRTA